MSDMQGASRRNRIVLLAAVGSAAVVAAACAALVVGEARVKSIPGLSIAVFGTFLTSMAIIAAFSIEESSRWPSPWEVLDRARVPSWFMVALGSVVSALLAGAIDSSFLSAFSLTLAIAAVPLGTWSLWGLIALSSDQGRWGLVVDLLAWSILEAPSQERSEPPDLGEIDTEDHVPDSFLASGKPRRPRRTVVALEQVPNVLCEYADRRDLEAVVRLLDELHAGACLALERRDSIGPSRYMTCVDTLLYVQRTAFVELANRVLVGQLGDATARIALVRAGEAFVDIAGRVRGVIDGADGHAIEVVVVRHLTALCRYAGRITQEVSDRLWASSSLTLSGEAPSESAAPGLQALWETSYELQQAARWAVDPDPPGMKIPSDHVWKVGLSVPESALVWLWSSAESASGPYGVGLYALCEILTGEKFLESYWDGFDIFTEIARRFGSGTRTERLSAGRTAVDRSGGLGRVALELGARRLAATPPRSKLAAFSGDPRGVDDRHAACNLFLCGAGFQTPGLDPFSDLAWLLTDRPEGDLWSLVRDELSKLPDTVLPPPLEPLYRFPAACVFAICLRLVPLQNEDTDGLRTVQEFLSALPDRLLRGAAEKAVGLATSNPSEVEEGRDWVGQLVESAKFARYVTPGPLPRQSISPRGLSAAHNAPLPTELTGSSFDGAIGKIRDAKNQLEVDLVQCEDFWLERWAGFRAVLDAALLEGALRGRLRVRRLILYDLSQDADRHSTRSHYRWTGGLTAAVGCFTRDDARESAYEVRRLILAGPGANSPPEDGIVIREPGDPAWREFDEVWTGPDPARGGMPGIGMMRI